MLLASHLRLLALPLCLTLTSCQALWSGGSRENRNGYSLDNPPSGRYLADSSTTTPPTTVVTTTPSGASTSANTTVITDDGATVTVDDISSTPPSIAPAPPSSTVQTPPSAPVNTTPAPESPSYGKPVPGRQGFVYPPGVDAKPENMVDVRDFTPGQKVRDPRTGKIFLVP